MKQLPSTWIECLVGDATWIVAGGTPPSKDASNFTTGDNGIPWITPADLSGYKDIYISHGARNLTEKGFSNCSAIKMPAGSVLFSSRAPIGYVAIAANEISTNQGFKSFVLPEELNNHFIYYYLKHIKSLAEDMATGTTFKELSGTATAKIPLIVAPFKEQKRIADKLDAVLARVDACRERLERVPLILKRFRQSVLAAAVTGKLTTDFRSGIEYQTTEFGWEIPESWELVTINDVAEVKGGKRLPKGEALVSNDTGYPYIRAGQLKNGTVVQDGQLYLTAAVQSQIARYIVNSGDVYITIVGACIGDAGVIPSSYQGANLTENAAKLCNLKKSISNIYLSLWLRSQLLQEIIQHEIKSGAQGKLALMRIKTLPFPCPPSDEQTEIVRRVEDLFAYADRLEARYATARAQVEKLTPALLAKAFRGELVPQDPSDEPASVLLERIRASRSEQPKTKRAHKPHSMKTLRTSKEKSPMTKSRHDVDVKGQPYLAKILRDAGGVAKVDELFKHAELPVADFYKQLAWEIESGHVRDDDTKLEAA